MSLISSTFNLDRLVCHDEADGWGNAEPYLWTVFFKIDGTTCRLGDSLFLEGTATIYTTPGSHGNLGNTNVDAGDTVPIPASIGHLEMSLTPIPVPDSLSAIGVTNAPAIAGCIAILMEEDNVTDAGANAGHQALNTAVQNALNNVIPTLGVLHQSITEAEINRITTQIQSQITDAIRNQQNWLENIWSWINSDDTIGTVVWIYSSKQLIEQNPINLNRRWTNDNGDWELFANINSREITCPANRMKEAYEKKNGADSAKNIILSMYDFRDTQFKEYSGLVSWWQLATRNSGFLDQVLKNEEVAEVAISIFNDIPKILKNREEPLSEYHYNGIMKILEHIQQVNVDDKQSRKDINRSIDALKMLEGKPFSEIVNVLSKVEPARYPALDLLKK